MRVLLLGLMAMVCGSVLTACDSGPEPLSVDDFLQQHWPAIIPPQGEPPQGYSAQEASLDPDDCGACHAAQFEQWRGSLHHQTMGLGIQWQLQLMDQQQGDKCLACHAPLAEQKALTAMHQQWPNQPSAAVPAWVPKQLADDGLVCAACHVRRHQRFGPPPRQQPAGDLPHDGFVISKAFQDSRFCATCHQHKVEQNPPTINGKLHMDTYRQWQMSAQGRAGIQCQQCHMPDRQHLWRGIHDADMTRSALVVNFEVQRSAQNQVRITSSLTNQGAGHHFPTYMVPKIELVFELLKPDAEVERELYRHVIGWQVNVALDRERFDTRIPAGETVRLSFPVNLPGSTDEQWAIRLRVEVAPREHYERTFRQSLQHADRLPPKTLNTLREALAEAEATRYRLLEQQRMIPALPIAN